MIPNTFNRLEFVKIMNAAGVTETGVNIVSALNSAIELRRSYIAGAAGGNNAEQIAEIQRRRSNAHYHLDCALRKLGLMGFPEEV